MKEPKIKNRDSDSQVRAGAIKSRHHEGQTAKLGFGPWIFVGITLAIFLSPIGERFVKYLKFRSTRTALKIQCDDRGNTNACVELSQLYYLNDYKAESRVYQKKVCDKFDHLEYCKEKI